MINNYLDNVLNLELSLEIMSKGYHGYSSLRYQVNEYVS